MKVQKVYLSSSNKVSWIVIGDDYLPIEPIQKFFSYMESIERSPNTIKSYAHHLKLYWEYLNLKRKDWKEITRSDIADFVAWLRYPQSYNVIPFKVVESARTEATVNRIMTALAMFYDFHISIEGDVNDKHLYTSRKIFNKAYKPLLHHVTKSSPVKSKIIKLKEPKTLPKTLTQEQVKQLIDACQRIRNKFLIALMYESGIRIGQALGLRHEDIHSWDNVVWVVPREDNINNARAKTKNKYPIDVSSNLMSIYSKYLIDELEEVDSDYVFINLWGGQIGSPMTYENVADLFRRLKKKTGVDAHPHMLRHTHATELIREGWDASRVQKRLGHSDVQTVLNTYTHLNDEDMKKAYKDFSIKKENNY